MSDYFLGIDVSKGYAGFILPDHKKNICEDVFQLDDTFDGHRKLIKMLNGFIDKQPGAVIFAAVESTGGLENNWLNMLYRLNDHMSLRAARIDPIGPNALHRASMQRNGPGAISARLIAEYMIACPEKVKFNMDGPYVALRKQYNFIEMLKKQQTQLLNQLSILLYTSMPFVVRYCRNGLPHWMLQLLLKYPSADKLARAQQKTVASIRYISHKRAGDLIEQARHNVGSVDETTSFVIHTMVKQIVRQKQLIGQHKSHMLKHCNLPEVKLLETFPGIGSYSAIGLVLNIVSIERFPTAKHLASYFGLHPVYKVSGDGSGSYHMSKKGRAVPRQILFMAARSAIVYNPLITEVFIDHIKRGKSKMSALGVCMHKILRIVFGMLKNNKAFDPQIDRRNRNKLRTLSPDGKKQENKKRRYQSVAEDAPVSRRQDKKRKGKPSQFAESKVCGINVSPSVV